MVPLEGCRWEQCWSQLPGLAWCPLLVLAATSLVSRLLHLRAHLDVGGWQGWLGRDKREGFGASKLHTLWGAISWLDGKEVGLLQLSTIHRDSRQVFLLPLGWSLGQEIIQRLAAAGCGAVEPRAALLCWLGRAHFQ